MQHPIVNAPLGRAFLGLLIAGFLFCTSSATQAEKAEIVQGHGGCETCHLKGGHEQAKAEYRTDEPAICYTCHEDTRNHQKTHMTLLPVDFKTTDLPTRNRMMSCVTCHDPHDKEALMLRKPTTELCATCHDT